VTAGLAFAPVVGFWRRWSTTFGASAGDEAATDWVLGWGTVVVVGAGTVLGVVTTAGVVDVVVEGWGVAAPASGAPVPAAGVVVAWALEDSVVTGGSAGVRAARAAPAKGPPMPAAVRPPPVTAESMARHAHRRALTVDIR